MGDLTAPRRRRRRCRRIRAASSLHAMSPVWRRMGPSIHKAWSLGVLDGPARAIAGIQGGLAGRPQDP